MVPLTDNQQRESLTGSDLFEKSLPARGFSEGNHTNTVTFEVVKMINPKSLLVCDFQLKSDTSCDFRCIFLATALGYFLQKVTHRQ